MPTSPLLSIVTVSLNAAETIADAIVSVANQSFSAGLEHICVDGGSRDGTRAIIDGWAGRLSHLRRVFEPDRGIYDAMNKGLRAATGEYVLFLNADDFLCDASVLTDAFSDLAQGSASNPDLIVGDVIMGTLGRRAIWRNRRVPRRLAHSRGTGSFPIHQGIFASRNLLLASGGFDASLKLAADVTLYYALEQHPQLSIRILDKNVAFMRSGGAANAGLGAMIRGTAEIYVRLSEQRGKAKALRMVATKTVQSLLEVRYGNVPCHRWFAQPN
jgi:glycosyltransferase